MAGPADTAPRPTGETTGPAGETTAPAARPATRPASKATGETTSPTGPATGSAGETTGRAGGEAVATGRLVGLDLARGVAVFGMYAAHVGPDPSEGGVTGFLMELTHGRSSALFAVLAGVGVVLVTGGPTPRTGRAGRQAVAKLVVRAVLLLGLGTALTMSGTEVEVILAFYGLYFLLVLPLCRLGAGALAMTAAATALVFPQVLYLVQPMVDGDWPTGPDGPDGLVWLLVGGTYPALTWVPFVVAGMAVARLDLGAAAVRTRLARAGVALAILGHGGSWLALRLVPGAARAVAASGWETGATTTGSAWWSDTAGYPTGDTPAWLLAASPHSETTLSIVANTGVAITVLVTCLAVAGTSRPARRLAAPAIAVGSMSLTAYVAHIVGIGVLGIEELPGSPLTVLVGFVAGAAVLATAWSRRFPRGPLESLMATATRCARHVP